MKYEIKLTKVLLLVTILFQLFFVLFCCFYADEIALAPNLVPVSYEEWGYLVNHPDLMDSRLISFVSIVKFVSAIIFVFGLLYLCTTGLFKKTVGMKKFMCAGIGFLAVYGIILFLIRRFVTEYKLFMNLIPAELLSLFLMATAILMLKNQKRPGTI